MRTHNLRECTKVENPCKFKLTEAVKKDFLELKEIISSETCLAHLDMKKDFYIHVDASGVGVGAILTQLDEKKKHRVLEYASSAFKQDNKSNPEREAYGILWSLDHFKYYVLGRQPIVYCDCSCLMDIFKSKDGNKSRTFNVWIARLITNQILNHAMEY